MNAFLNRFRRRPQPPILVVSGLPRSGTSMMMKMLEAGGAPVLSDGQRAADRDNPRGYYEFERVKQLDKGDTAWLGDARGKAVKVISALLPHLPDDYVYHILFMRRALDEVLASQQRMLVNRAEADQAVSDEEMAQLFQSHVAQTLAWVAQQPNMTLLEVDYNVMLAEPRPVIAEIAAFMPLPLDTDAMAAVVDPALYRNRG